jgi:gamma-glutamylcyclotransferase (GGCT)/AIG2-like uncharacterized protein YtfP
VTDVRAADRARRGEPTAFFVYGTLRPGQPNFQRISGLVVRAEPAILRGHVLYGHGMPCPYAGPGSGRVVGDLLWVKPEAVGEALGILDALEGYREGRGGNLYERRSLAVTNQRGQVQVWVYLAGDAVLADLTPDLVVPSGDWRHACPSGEASALPDYVGEPVRRPAGRALAAEPSASSRRHGAGGGKRLL